MQPLQHQPRPVAASRVPARGSLHMQPSTIITRSSGASVVAMQPTAPNFSSSSSSAMRPTTPLNTAAVPQAVANVSQAAQAFAQDASRVLSSYAASTSAPAFVPLTPPKRPSRPQQPDQQQPQQQSLPPQQQPQRQPVQQAGPAMRPQHQHQQQQQQGLKPSSTDQPSIRADSARAGAVQPTTTAASQRKTTSLAAKAARPALLARRRRERRQARDSQVYSRLQARLYCLPLAVQPPASTMAAVANTTEDVTGVGSNGGGMAAWLMPYLTDTAADEDMLWWGSGSASGVEGSVDKRDSGNTRSSAAPTTAARLVKAAAATAGRAAPGTRARPQAQAATGTAAAGEAVGKAAGQELVLERLMQLAEDRELRQQQRDLSSPLIGEAREEEGKGSTAAGR